MTENIAAPHLEGQPRPNPAPVRSAPPTGRSKAERIALVGIFGLGVLYTLYLARDLLLPVFLALLLSLLLRPLVKGLRRIGVPETAGAAIIVLILLLLMGYGLYSLSGPAATWIERWPVIMRQIEFKLGDIRQAMEDARQATRQIEEMARENNADAPQVVVQQGPSLTDQLLTRTQTIFAQFFIILVLLFFFLAQGRQMLERLIGTMTNIEDRVHYATIANTVQRKIAAYLATVTVINSCLGLLTALAMMALEMPNPALWGVMAGLFNFIPYLGAATTLVVLTLVSALTFDELFRIALPPLCFLLLTSMEGSVITPLVVGRRLTLNPIAVFLSILFWGWLWGIPGALMAVPVLAVLKILCESHKSLQPISALLGG